MDSDLLLLCVTAVTVALVHTLCGPDHYIPFVAMSRAGGWSFRKTVFITLLSGLGHVGSSILLGFMGIALGEMVARLEIFDATRGRAAGWMMIAFGFGYLVWGMVQVYRHPGQTHCSVHGHHDGAHQHEGSELSSEHSRPVRLTPWILFTIFIFGPCEPLIPLLMYPAAQSSLWGVFVVSLLFAVTTIATMMFMVLCLMQCSKVIRLPGLHTYSHALAGMAVMLCGCAISFGL